MRFFRGLHRLPYVERPCIGCFYPFKRWGITQLPMIEQCCSKRCKKSFLYGYDLGLRVLGDIRRRRHFS